MRLYISGELYFAEFDMALTEHISDEIFDFYAGQNAGPSEILRLQRHVAVCDECRAKLARAVNTEKAFVALHQSFSFDDYRDEPEHPVYEKLEFFMDGKLDDVEREIVESHLSVCSECSKDSADLQMYRKIAAAPRIAASGSAIETPKPGLWQKLFAFDSIGSFAPVAAVLLIVVLFGAWFFLRADKKGEIAQINNQNISPAVNNLPANNIIAANASPEMPPQTLPSPEVIPPDKENLYAINDGQLKIDDKNNIEGTENLSSATQNLIKQSLQTGKIAVADNSLGSGGGVLMGENKVAGVPFALASPVGKVIKENRPVLRWKPLRDAQNYSVAIVDESFRVVEQSGKLQATSWKPAKPLLRGANYSWQVTATLADGTETVSPLSPAPQARFRVIEQNLFDEINRLETSRSPSHLALGVLYAKAGLRSEARAEFEKLAWKNPNSLIARKFLQSVR